MEITPHTPRVSNPIVEEKQKDLANLKQAVEGFETLFAHELLESMQKDLEGSSLFGGGVEGNTIGAMAQWELAGKLAEGFDLGLERHLKAQLESRKENT